ncbi:hypothetical protein PRIPAC_88266 [Pristionchus pacificus]|uniref:Uncharacterized protein n=1 Tax=Pristionchus pacificus TaxID=54126 RepID=A0A2A6CVI4_PRIPA|nr:hypothetical protein PRIPAC_88266 [Pristionchus pacificus]|eukprot:PDM82195.1 hypothetical protein PRIPAC_36588 [Pristionchus pacificus]
MLPQRDRATMTSLLPSCSSSDEDTVRDDRLLPTPVDSTLFPPPHSTTVGLVVCLPPISSFPLIPPMRRRLKKRGERANALGPSGFTIRPSHLALSDEFIWPPSSPSSSHHLDPSFGWHISPSLLYSLSSPSFFIPPLLVSTSYSSSSRLHLLFLSCLGYLLY